MSDKENSSQPHEMSARIGLTQHRVECASTRATESPRRSRSTTPSPEQSDRHSSYGSLEHKSSDYRNRSDGYHREHSRSPMSSRRRHVGNRENPPQGRCLGIFGLSIYTQERDLKEVFSKYGPIEDVQIVYDAQSGRSRGFAFVYYECSDDAKLAKNSCNGMDFDGRKIRVKFSMTGCVPVSHSCMTCGKTFSKKQYELDHRRTFHLKSKMNYSCKLCGQTFSWRASILKHIKKLHQSVHNTADMIDLLYYLEE